MGFQPMSGTHHDYQSLFPTESRETRSRFFSLSRIARADRLDSININQENRLMGMHKSGGTKNRGRSKITGDDTTIANKGALQLEKRTDSSRPVTPGGGKNRGDRRDMNKTFTGTNRRQPNLSNPKSR
jgi:hypothetical protein